MTFGFGRLTSMPKVGINVISSKKRTKAKGMKRTILVLYQKVQRLLRKCVFEWLSVEHWIFFFKYALIRS